MKETTKTRRRYEEDEETKETPLELNNGAWEECDEMWHLRHSLPTARPDAKIDVSIVRSVSEFRGG
jgi:hypothetical protein